VTYLDPSNGEFIGEDAGEPWRKALRIGAPIALLIIVAVVIWMFALQETGVRRPAPEISTLIPIEQPPPPPPTRTPPPPEPKPPEQLTPPTPAPPTPQPPTPAPAQPTVGQNAVTQNAPAQAGSDAFNIGAGSGQGARGFGGVGGGETAGMYGQYAKDRIRDAIRADPVLKAKDLRTEVLVWFEPTGQVRQVELTKGGTGVGAYDAEVKKVVGRLGLRAPPQDALARMPIHFTIDERRPL
jgi:outer membrane biosynthesis protein TonB